MAPGRRVMLASERMDCRDPEPVENTVEENADAIGRDAVEDSAVTGRRDRALLSRDRDGGAKLLVVAARPRKPLSMRCTVSAVRGRSISRCALQNATPASTCVFSMQMSESKRDRTALINA